MPVERPFICDYEYCGKAFKTNYNLRRHAKIHGPRSYQCPVNDCPFTAHQPGGIKQHMGIHYVERRPTCQFCLRTLSDASALTTHLKSAHGNVYQPQPRAPKAQPNVTPAVRYHPYERPTSNAVIAPLSYSPSPAPNDLYLPFHPTQGYHVSNPLAGHYSSNLYDDNFEHGLVPRIAPSDYSEQTVYYSSRAESPGEVLHHMYSPSDRTTASPVGDDGFFQPPTSPAFGFPESQERCTLRGEH